MDVPALVRRTGLWYSPPQEREVAVERMPGVDAGFLYMETPTLHMHTLKIGVLDPTAVPGGYSFERLREALAARLHLLPSFRRRVVPVPLGLHHPVWVEDPRFDLDRHLFRRHAPPPGGQRQLEAVIGAIASRPLDRRRPLWELTVVEGLEGGRVATVAKIHHAVADGTAAAAMLAAVMAESLGDSLEDVPDPEPWRPDRLPTRGELVRDALRDRWTQLRGLPGLLAATWEKLRALAALRRGSDGPRSPRPILDAPDAPFNRALSRDRIFTTTSLPLDAIKEVKEAHDVTFNDVVLALVAGSLRAWLDAHDHHLARPLVAAVPVGTDDAGSPRLIGNRVSSLFTSLCTDVDDPVERLRCIHDVTGAAKQVQETLGLTMLEDWTEYTPPGPFAAFMRAYSRLRAANLHRPPVNLVVSNVPGPREPLFIGGAELVDLFSVGPVLDGIGLNLTAWSYVDRLNVSAIACRATMPDVREVTDGLATALDELVRASAPAPATHRSVAAGRAPA